MARSPNLGLDRFSGVYLFVIIVAIFGLWTPSTFLTMSTLHSVAAEQAISAMVALAVLIPLAANQFDLSVGATANVTGIVASQLQVNNHWNLVPAILVALAIGVVIGVANAVVVIVLRVSSFIATLASGSILAAALIMITGNAQPQPVVNNAWNDLTQINVGGFQIIVLYMLVLAVIVWWWLDHTPSGRYIYATGNNVDAARLSGIRTNHWSFMTLVASGSIAGLAGILYISLTGPSISFGPELLLPAFAAVFLGSTQLQPGRFNVWGTLLAIYVLAAGIEGLQLVSGQAWLSDLFDGVALIIAVAVSVRRIGRPQGRGWRRRRGDGVAAALDGTETQHEVNAADVSVPVTSADSANGQIG
jgi:ribose transport system permease protein